MTKWICLAIGGILGTFARYLFSNTIYSWVGSRFPYGTLAVNLLGCFILGFLATVSQEKFFIHTESRLLLMVGFCGAFTTFSTWIFETDNLMRQGDLTLALANLIVSVAAGFLIFRAGISLGKLI